MKALEKLKLKPFIGAGNTIEIHSNQGIACHWIGMEGNDFTAKKSAAFAEEVCNRWNEHKPLLDRIEQLRKEIELLNQYKDDLSAKAEVVVALYKRKSLNDAAIYDLEQSLCT